MKIERIENVVKTNEKVIKKTRKIRKMSLCKIESTININFTCRFGK